MGLTGISIWQLLIILAIVIVLFGTKRLKTLGSDLGGMIKGFKNSMNSHEDPPKTDEQRAQEPPPPQQPQPIVAQQTAAPQPVTEKADQNNKV